MYVGLLLAVLEAIARLYFSMLNVRWTVPDSSQNDVNNMDGPAVAVARAGARESPKYYVLNHHRFLYNFFNFFLIFVIVFIYTH